MEETFDMSQYNLTKEEEILAKKLAPFIVDLIIAKQKYDRLILESTKINMDMKKKVDLEMGWSK